MGIDVRQMNTSLLALVAIAIGVVALSAVKDSTIVDIQQAVTTVAALLALLSLGALVLHVITPGAIDLERVGALAIGVSAGAAVYHGSWGAYLPLAGMVAVIGVLKYRAAG